MSDAMDLSPEPESAPSNPLPTPDVPAAQRPPLHWVKRLLNCNPFYLFSTVLLLYGMYRVSCDTGFLRGEIAQLTFNLSSLQVYEVLVAVTAIFLARRLLWYDSTLLVCLENLLVLVPFILITQAALIELRLVWGLSLGAALLALVRFGALRRWIAPLNFPRRLVPLGLVLLAVNVALPIVYRILEQSKIGARPDFGAAYYTDQYVWLLLLPALCALANLLPDHRNTGESLAEQGWLPTAWFSLWLAGTVVHLYCLGYIYEFALSPRMTAPAVWVLLWTVQLRAAPSLARQSQAWRAAALTAPLVATFLGVCEPWNGVFLTLTLLNVMVYGYAWLRRGRQAAVLALCLFSLMGLLGGMPQDWGTRLVAGFDRGGAIAAALGGYVVLWAALSRSPKGAVGGAVIIGLFLLGVLGRRADAVHWALQGALVFVLLHSLRWEDSEHVGASALRIIAAILWVGDAGVWMHTGGVAWSTCALAGPVLAAYGAASLLGRRWGPLTLPVAAVLVMLMGPGNMAADKLQAAPAGLLAVVGSFLLFGVGTLVAVSRRKWLA